MYSAYAETSLGVETDVLSICKVPTPGELFPGCNSPVVPRIMPMLQVENMKDIAIPSSTPLVLSLLSSLAPVTRLLAQKT